MSSTSLVDARRTLVQATEALTEGAGALGTLECRLDSARVRFLGTPARDLTDLEARLLVIREVVAALGPRGYLLDLVDAALSDVQGLKPWEARGSGGGKPPPG